MAQMDDDQIFVAERPGISTPPNIVAHRKVQLENGLQMTNFYQGDVHNINYFFSSLVVRYGFVPHAELRLQTDYAYNIEKDSSGTYIVSGTTPITIGTKIKLVKQKKVLPSISFLFDLTLPFIGNKDLRPDNFAPSFCLLFANDIGKKMNLCYNYGMSWYGDSPVPTHFYSLSFDFRLPNNWNIYIEGYGFSTLHASSSFYFDTGASYLINDHLQADLSVGGYLNSISDYYMVNMGISWKIMGKRGN